ncbi:hypothetical protein AURDEDRAFT_144155 [Auricularia subglabra TFB-10046 SS5]|nr:hypothetical protein AURDEDRAFT_144155 [Auricularia subglabra TFB-10046 SS5]
MRIAPVWGHSLAEIGYDTLLDQYFCPVSVPSRSYGECIAILSYSTLLSNLQDSWSLDLLGRLCTTFSLADLHWAAWHGPFWTSPAKRALAWEDVVRIVPSVPSKVANARREMDVPSSLETTAYMTRLCTELHQLAGRPDADVNSLSSLVVKLVNLGLFPVGSSLAIGQTSFFATVLPQLSRRAKQPKTLWPQLLASMPAVTLQKILASVLSSLHLPADALDLSLDTRTHISQQTRLVTTFTGAEDVDADVVDAFVSVVVDREWTEGHARIVHAVATLWGGGTPEVLLRSTSELWSSTQYIKHSLLQRHRYVTLLLLLAVSSFAPKSPPVLGLALSTSFINAVSVYIGHLDAAVRRCGMLVAEEVAARTGRALNFDGWDGKGEGREWARDVRKLVNSDTSSAPAPEPEPEPAYERSGDCGHTHESLAPVNAPDSDDESLVGYDSDDASSRSSSPDAEQLDAIRREPSLAVAQRKKPRKPVYLLELAAMLQNNPKPEQADETADKMEVALQCAEDLIRRKEGFGLELDENAVNLAFALVCLQDNYDLPNFVQNRQCALTALVACCPTKAAPALIEQFFNDQHSIAQRFAILNALTFGARELAGLGPDAQAAPAFPSKMLPPAQHAKYSAQESETQKVQALLGGMTRSALERTREAHPLPAPMQRERQLRVRQPAAGIIQVDKERVPAPGTGPAKRQPFATIAAEYFVMPLINRFWTYAGDAQTRQARKGRTSAGGAVLLGPLVLSQFATSLAVLLHAARHSPAFLSVLAPEALQLAVTLGTQATQDDSISAEADDEQNTPAAVLTAALELALVVLDACGELDGGRALALERATLVLALEDWADTVFKGLESGLRVKGGGGALEAKLRSAAAGVGVKIAEVTERWRRSMIAF